MTLSNISNPGKTNPRNIIPENKSTTESTTRTTRCRTNVQLQNFATTDNSNKIYSIERSNSRRRFLKLSTALAGIGSSLSIFSGAATAAWDMQSAHFSDINEPAGDGDQLPTHQNLTININSNRADLDDWVLIENLTEQPLTLSKFEPRYVFYNGKELDLDALLTRKQRGKHQLEVWPNHAWSHSVKGAIRRTAEPTEIESTEMTADHRSIQLPCRVNSNGVVHLIDHAIYRQT